MFGTIDQRSALDTHPASVGSHLVVGTDHARFHVEADDELIALLPSPLDIHIAVFRYQERHGDTIDDEAVAEAFAVGILIEVAGHHLVAQPARDAHLQVELSHGVLVDGQHRLTVPGVFGLLGQRQLLASHVECGRVGEEEVQIDVLALHGVDVAGQRGNESADVARTAGTAEPSLTLVLTHRLQGIRIEEAVAFERHTADQTVVERALQHIVILRLAMQQEQAVVHIHIADGGTGLAVGTHVRQFVVGTEGLAVVGGSDTTGDVELLRDDVVPDGIDGLDVVLIACEGSHISHTSIHIGRTYGVTYGLVLFDDGLVSLRIVVCDGRLATIVEQELGKVKIALLSCGQIESCHCHLCNLMAWHHAHLTRIWPNLLTSHVGITAGDVEELALARSLPVGHGTLHHVTEVIELVREVFLLHPTLVTSPVVGICGVLGAGSVEITVRLLG